jgi:IclR family acetate operon transcriptional repressor
LSGKSDADIAAILQAKGFKRFTEHTVKSLPQLMKVIRKTRLQGFSESWEDVTVGVGSLGAPVLDALRNVVGAISIGGLLTRYEGNHKTAYIQLVQETAARISKDLGYAASPTRQGGRKRR